jgi:hypothetical protein
MQQALQACQDKAPAGGFGGGGGQGGQQAFQAYSSCMQDHGVTIAQPSSGGTPPTQNQNDPKFTAANQACSALLPSPGASSATTTPEGAQ